MQWSRIELLKTELMQTDDMRECDKIQERITKLASGVAVIKVGAATEVEMIEKKHRIEDALEALQLVPDFGLEQFFGFSHETGLRLLAFQTGNHHQSSNPRLSEPSFNI